MSDEISGRGRDPSLPVYVPYMERLRERALRASSPSPHRWSHFASVPFQPLRVPLETATVALITTAAELRPGIGDQGPGAPYNAAAKFDEVVSRSSDEPIDLRISHVGYDRVNARVEDAAVYFPLSRLKQAVDAGRVGRVAARFHSVPTERNETTTLERDAPRILERLREDRVDAAILVGV